MSKIEPVAWIAENNEVDENEDQTCPVIVDWYEDGIEHLAPGTPLYATDPNTLREMIERLVDALEHITSNAEAWPEDMFPEPDWKRAAQVLKDNGMLLDNISGGVLRLVVGNMAKKAREPLAEAREMLK